ncbi:hypothetical protein Q5P01_016422 [Channa striata]|uniref:Uncharacterized protein n=1 Tax=Channa striata TaxID=64152 RepID=A0AA88ME31_CHASR|nr:hypothetical protein Q5P01_016422 [Channa striata]
MEVLKVEKLFVNLDSRNAVDGNKKLYAIYDTRCGADEARDVTPALRHGPSSSRTPPTCGVFGAARSLSEDVELSAPVEQRCDKRLATGRWRRGAARRRLRGSAAESQAAAATATNASDTRAR